MVNSFRLPDDFEQKLRVPVKNADERLAEAREIGSKLAEGGIHLNGQSRSLRDVHRPTAPSQRTFEAARICCRRRQPLLSLTRRRLRLH